jgi:NAD(P)-dependent dehydrogenase (short-subunit alcohol dehydrogenase family)
MSRVVCVLGASSGIGRAVAAACLARGDSVHGIARQGAALDLPGLIAHPLDAREAEALTAVLEGVGPLDHLVLTMNAGSATGPFAGLPLARIRAAFDNKVFPYMAAILAAAPRIRAGGAITLVTGAAGRSAQRGMGVLAATNGALNHLTEVLALELAPIRVNAVSPGVTATAYWAGVPEADRAGFFDSVAGRTPLGRVATADEIAAAVMFVMDHPFTTGTILDCDGGARLT